MHCNYDTSLSWPYRVVANDLYNPLYIGNQSSHRAYRSVYETFVPNDINTKLPRCADVHLNTHTLVQLLRHIRRTDCN